MGPNDADSATLSTAQILTRQLTAFTKNKMHIAVFLFAGRLVYVVHGRLACYMGVIVLIKTSTVVAHNSQLMHSLLVPLRDGRCVEMNDAVKEGDATLVCAAGMAMMLVSSIVLVGQRKHFGQIMLVKHVTRRFLVDEDVAAETVLQN